MLGRCEHDRDPVGDALHQARPPRRELGLVEGLLAQGGRGNENDGQREAERSDGGPDDVRHAGS